MPGMVDLRGLQVGINGRVHDLRLRPVDSKPGEVTVWEGMVDASTLYWFEAFEKLDDWSLIELAIGAYLDYVGDESVTAWKWGSN